MIIGDRIVFRERIGDNHYSLGTKLFSENDIDFLINSKFDTVFFIECANKNQVVRYKEGDKLEVYYLSERGMVILKHINDNTYRIHGIESIENRFKKEGGLEIDMKYRRNRNIDTLLEM